MAYQAEFEYVDNKLILTRRLAGQVHLVKDDISEIDLARIRELELEDRHKSNTSYQQEIGTALFSLLDGPNHILIQGLEKAEAQGGLLSIEIRPETNPLTHESFTVNLPFELLCFNGDFLLPRTPPRAHLVRRVSDWGNEMT